MPESVTQPHVYKTELHCHCAPVSRCATVTPEELAEIYTAAGYTSLVLTNHINGATFGGREDLSWEKNITWYLEPYHRLQQAAAGRLHVLLGLELTPEGDNNDYLVFGVTEELLRAHPNLRQYPLDKVAPMLQEAGCLVCQAHPFRDNMTVRPPALLDGYEVCNAAVNHDSRNDIAAAWAARFHKIATSGSDFHQQNIHTAAGGILTAVPLCDNAALLNTLKSGDYTLILP